VREIRPSGSVWGIRSNPYPYRDPAETHPIVSYFHSQSGKFAYSIWFGLTLNNVMEIIATEFKLDPRNKLCILSI